MVCVNLGWQLNLLWVKVREWYPKSLVCYPIVGMHNIGYILLNSDAGGDQKLAIDHDSDVIVCSISYYDVVLIV